MRADGPLTYAQANRRASASLWRNVSLGGVPMDAALQECSTDGKTAVGSLQWQELSSQHRTALHRHKNDTSGASEGGGEKDPQSYIT